MSIIDHPSAGISNHSNYDNDHSLLHHDQQVLLLNTKRDYNSAVITKTSRKTVTEHKVQKNFQSRTTACLIYMLLLIVSISMVYFNYQIYEKYINHHVFIDTSLSSTKHAITQKQNEIYSSINSFILDYAQRFQKFKLKFEVLETKMEEIKKESQYLFDKIQLLSIKNGEQLAQINAIANQQKVYAQEIKDYHQNVDVHLKQQNNYFSRNQRQDMLQIQSIAWIFTENYESDDQYLRKLYLNNLKKYAYMSNFQIKFINKNNYLYFLSPEILTKISNIFSILERRLSNHDRTNLGDHFQTIKKILIMVGILYEHGGVIFIDNVALTEPLYWLHNTNILKQFNNNFNQQMPPKVVSFFNNYYSAKKVTIKSDFFKETYMYPNIQRYFIAAIKKSEFIGKMIDQMINILKSPYVIKKKISQQYDMGLLKGQDPFYEFFYIAGHIVIQDKQKQLDKISKEGKKLYAVDYYGLYTLNCMAGPMKLKAYFKGETEAYIYNNLMDITRKQFENKVGSIRFLHIFDNYGETNRQMLNIRNNKRLILNKSFTHDLLLAHQESKYQYFVYSRPQPLQKNQRVWSNLPKKLWIYSNGQQNSEINKLIMQSNTKINKQAGFEVLAVNSKVISYYISKQILNDVTDKFRKSRFANAQSLKEYTLMLCLLSNQGGIYIDSSYLLTQDLQWLHKINDINQGLLVNKMGNTPKMFMFHNNHDRYRYNYTFDSSIHSRIDDRLVYEKSFIAVEKESLLLDEWIQQILKSIALSNEQLDRKFEECGLRDEVQYKKNIDNLPIDILRCIYVKGLKQVKKENYGKETNLYNLWSIDGDFSAYKIRKNTNFENVDQAENKFIADYAMADTEQRIGQIFKMIKFDNANLDYLNRKYNFRGDNPYKSIHKQSIFAKYFLIKN